MRTKQQAMEVKNKKKKQPVNPIKPKKDGSMRPAPAPSDSGGRI